MAPPHPTLRVTFSPREKEILRLQFRIPVEIIEPAVVQIVRRKESAVIVQILHGRLVWLLRREHAGLLRELAALAQVARRTGGHDVLPGRLAAVGTGMTWSKVRSSWEPQYWHSNLSRRKTLKRVKAGLRDGCTYVFRHTTLGSRIEKLGEDTH